jgi:mannose-6-phosphate isomerase-like protein (cupin superfamily)
LFFVFVVVLVRLGSGALCLPRPPGVAMLGRMEPVVDLTKTYLYAEGADLVPVTAETLWKRLMSDVPAGPAEERVARGSGWLIGVFRYGETWSTWEMHPEADEVVHILAGAITFVLDEAGRERRVEVRAGTTLVVPRGAWHRAIVHEPGEALHVTFGKGTEHRPATA